jgi:hypothetical protein
MNQGSAFVLCFLLFVQGCTTRFEQIQEPNPKKITTEAFSIDTFDVNVLPVKLAEKLRVSVLPIGAGNCVLMELPQGLDGETTIILNDCGSTGQGVTGWNKATAVSYIDTILRQYINQAGKFEAQFIVVVSHADTDHYNIIPSLNAGAVSEVWLGGNINDYNQAMGQWLNNIINRVGQNAINSGFNKSLSRIMYQRQTVLGDATLEMLTVNSSDNLNGYGEKNADSLVTRLEINEEYSITNAGDATAETILAVMENSESNDIDIFTDLLIAPHHGSSTHGSNSYLIGKAFLPNTVVFSAGDRHNHPKCSALQAYYPSQLQLSHIYNYNPNIDNTTGHQVRCSENGAYVSSNTIQDIWVTSTTGLWIRNWGD